MKTAREIRKEIRGEMDAFGELQVINKCQLDAFKAGMQYASLLIKEKEYNTFFSEEILLTADQLTSLPASATANS